MIDVQLTVDGGGVFIVGQTIKCVVTLHNPTDQPDRLAWATGQISGHLKVDERRVVVAREAHPHATSPASLSSSSLTRHGSNDGFFSSDPDILFCDLEMPPNSTKVFTFSGTVPTHLPPSYRGSYIKYSYLVLVGLQRVNRPVSLISLPIRIINLPGISHTNGPSSTAKDHPFAKKEPTINFEDIFMDKVQSLCCKKTRSFEVKTNAGLVCVVRLSRSAYRLGDPIEVDLEFGDVSCVQVTLKLQAMETISPEHETIPETDSRFTTHDVKTINCIHTASTSASLHIPLNVVNSFSTNLVLVRWQVHFEFLISQLQPSPGELVDLGNTLVSGEVGSDCEWRPLQSVPVSTLTWEMPVRVVPTIPQYIATIAWQRTQAKDTV